MFNKSHKTGTKCNYDRIKGLELKNSNLNC